jgi:hypothetical protein
LVDDTDFIRAKIQKSNQGEYPKFWQKIMDDKYIKIHNKLYSLIIFLFINFLFLINLILNKKINKNY